jgi:hypothetical protein
MLELTEEGRRLVEALVRAPVAWQSPAELARALGRDLEETTDLLASLDAEGWLSAWELEPDVVVTLSVGAASRLGLRLVESGREEVPRWAGMGDPEPPSPRASGVFRGDRAARLELVVDPSLTPQELAERAEEAPMLPASPSDRRDRDSLQEWPTPTLLVGSGLTPWPGPGDGRKASCPSCRSRRLGPSAYCLYCDRWGLDHLIVDATVARVRSPRAGSRRPGPKDDDHRRELGRQDRKARRRARQFAQSKAEPGPRRPRRALP